MAMPIAVGISVPIARARHADRTRMAMPIARACIALTLFWSMIR
jgi:hypothetical protein